MSLTPDPVPAIEARHEEYTWSGSHADVAYVSGIHRDRGTLLAHVRELRAENERMATLVTLAQREAQSFQRAFQDQTAEVARLQQVQRELTAQIPEPTR